MENEEFATAAVNKIEKTFGKYPAYRRAHARGAGYEAVFTATGAGKNWTIAPHFREGSTRAVVRFSHSSPDQSGQTVFRRSRAWPCNSIFRMNR